MVTNSFGNRNFMQPTERFNMHSKCLDFFSLKLGRGGGNFFSFILCSQHVRFKFPMGSQCVLYAPHISTPAIRLGEKWWLYHHITLTDTLWELWIFSCVWELRQLKIIVINDCRPTGTWGERSPHHIVNKAWSWNCWDLLIPKGKTPGRWWATRGCSSTTPELGCGNNVVVLEKPWLFRLWWDIKWRKCVCVCVCVCVKE
jgi:hypothetical protein